MFGHVKERRDCTVVLERLGVLADEVSADFEEALNWAAKQGLKHHN